MKSIFTFSFIFSTFLLFAFWVNNPNSRFFPAPTDRSHYQEEGEEKQEKWKEYYELMHQTPDGVNWRSIELQNREELQAWKMKKIKQLGRSTSDDFYKDTIDGDIVGHWREVGSHNVAGRVLYTDYKYATNELYLATDGGSIWKGNINGTNWTCQNNLFQLNGIIFLKRIDFGNIHNLLAVSENEGAHFSADDGHTWTVCAGLNNVTQYGRCMRAVSAHPILQQIYLFCQDNQGTALYRSDDFGQSFYKALNLNNLGGANDIDIWSDADGSGEVYLLFREKIYKVVNNVLTQIGTIPESFPNSAVLQGAEINGNTYLYVRYENGGTNNFWASSDAGQTWTAKGTLADGMFMKNSFGVSQITPNLIFCGNVNAYYSNDAGDNWTLINEWWQYYGNESNMLHADIPSILSVKTSNNAEIIFTNTDGGCFKSTTGGQTFENISLQGLHNSQYYSVYTNRNSPNYIYAGSQDQGFQRSNTDNGTIVNFLQTISGDYGHLCSGDGGQSIWCDYPGFVMYYPDAAGSLQNATWDFAGAGQLWLAPIAEDPVNPLVCYYGGGSTTTGTHLFKLTYNPNNQAITSNELTYNFGGSAITSITHSPIIKDERYVLNTSGKVHYSLDAGVSWAQMTNVNAPTNHYFYGASIVASPKTLGRVYVGGSGYGSSNGVVQIDNYGATQTAITNGLPHTMVFQLAVTPDEKYIFAATEAGPYIYKTATQQWHYLGGISAPSETFWSVEYIPSLNVARFGTYGRGIWDFVICDQNTPIPSANFNTAPSGTNYAFQNLSQNAYFYEWTFGDGTTDNTQNPTHLYTANGTYTVQLIASNFCTSDTFTQILNINNVGIAAENTANLEVYPNPNKGNFTLCHTGIFAPTVNYLLYNMSGQLVWKKENERLFSQENTEIQLSNVAAGVYILKIQDASGRILGSKKVMIE